MFRRSGCEPGVGDCVDLRSVLRFSLNSCGPNPNDVGIARRKAKVMEDLCGAQAFPMIFWILSSELALAAKARGIKPERNLQCLEDVIFGGQWIRTELPSVESMFAGFGEKMEKVRETQFVKVVGRKPNRAERRRLDKLLPMEDARRVVAEAEVYPIIKDTPLFDRFADGFRRGRIPEVTEAFFRFVARPTRLIMSHDHLHSMGFLNDQVSSLKSAFYDASQRCAMSLIGFARPADRKWDELIGPKC